MHQHIESALLIQRRNLKWSLRYSSYKSGQFYFEYAISFGAVTKKMGGPQEGFNP